MSELILSLTNLGVSLLLVIVQLANVIWPWLPLIAWVVFWMFAVNWTKLRPMLVEQGGWLGLLLLGFVWVVVWGVVNPPLTGSYDVFGLTLSNFVGKAVYVTGLLCLALLAGAAQLSGVTGRGSQFEEDPPEIVAHGNDDGHGHADHGHAHDAAHGHAPAAHGAH